MASKPCHQPLEVLGVLWPENQGNMSPIGEVGKTAGGVCMRTPPTAAVSSPNMLSPRLEHLVYTSEPASYHLVLPPVHYLHY